MSRTKLASLINIGNPWHGMMSDIIMLAPSKADRLVFLKYHSQARSNLRWICMGSANNVATPTRLHRKQKLDHKNPSNFL